MTGRGEYEYSHPDPTYDFGYLLPSLLSICRTRRVRSVLDIGCGNGALTRRIFAAGYDVTGIETSLSGVRWARHNLPTSQIIHASVYDDPAALTLRRYDLVMSIEVIEHLYSPRALLQFARRYVAPSGAILISTPYHSYLKNLLIALANGWDRHADPNWDHGHIKFFSCRTLERLFHAEGFRMIQIGRAGRVSILAKSMVAVAEPL
jgi:2-polyprenyl-6-hydroxyphenyl methylase/3-demethylubiquinone-9 3-methyltransferase